MKEYFTTTDKLQHILASFVIVLYIWAWLFTLNCDWVGFAVANILAIGVGLYKEFKFDKVHGGHTDRKDLIADFIGIGLADIAILWILLKSLPR